MSAMASQIISVMLIYSQGNSQEQTAMKCESKMFHSRHYSDIIMSAKASQITSVSIVYSTVCSGVDQIKHQSPASPPFVTGDRWIPRTKGQWRGKCFHLMTSSWHVFENVVCKMAILCMIYNSDTYTWRTAPSAHKLFITDKTKHKQDLGIKCRLTYFLTTRRETGDIRGVRDVTSKYSCCFKHIDAFHIDS